MIDAHGSALSTCIRCKSCLRDFRNYSGIYRNTNFEFKAGSHDPPTGTRVHPSSHSGISSDGWATRKFGWLIFKRADITDLHYWFPISQHEITARFENLISLAYSENTEVGFQCRVSQGQCEIKWRGVDAYIHLSWYNLVLIILQRWFWRCTEVRKQGGRQLPIPFSD